MVEERVVVTGGAGFIGSHIVDKLVEQGLEVVVVDNLSSGSIENLKHHLEKGTIVFERVDLKNWEEVKRVIRDAEAVLHYAANPEVRVSTTHPEVHFRENVLTTFNVLEAMRVNDVATIVFASSSSVYGEPEEIPVGENAPIKPVSVYGASKAACENFIHAYSKLYGFNAVILRYANIVGSRLRHGVIYDFLLKLLSNQLELEVLGDGMQTRSYLYISDAVNATITAWQRSPKGFSIYNVGNEDWITVSEVAHIVLSELGLLGKTKVKYKPVLHGVGWPGDVKKIALDISRLKELGWKPKLDSREAVRRTVRDLVAELGIAFPST